MRNTVKGWLKNQEKAKADDQDKTEGQDEHIAASSTEKPHMNGDVQADMSVDTAQDQPQVDLAENEEVAADVQPSVEVRCQTSFLLLKFVLTWSHRNLITKLSITTTTLNFRWNWRRIFSNFLRNDPRVPKKPLNRNRHNPSSPNRSHKTSSATATISME